MKHAKSLGRTFLLIALLTVGTGLIWQIGRNFSQPKPDPVPEAPVAPPAEPVVAPPDIHPATQARGSDAIVRAGAQPKTIRTDRGRFIATDPILFNSGLTTLRDASMPKLDKIAGFLIRNPDISIEIIGHTDNLGPEPVNQKVSADRARIVMDYLVSQGIDPARLTSRGMGSLDPIDSNDTQLGRQANRRIEFLVRDGAAALRQ